MYVKTYSVPLHKILTMINQTIAGLVCLQCSPPAPSGHRRPASPRRGEDTEGSDPAVSYAHHLGSALSVVTVLTDQLQHFVSPQFEHVVAIELDLAIHLLIVVDEQAYASTSSSMTLQI